MVEEVLLTESYGSVMADANVPCVIVQFHGFANKHEFKHVMEAGLAYYVQHSTPTTP
jgi:hypothetical protein